MNLILSLFGGGGNIMENIKFNKRYFYDINKELIEFYKALVNGWEMPEPNSFDNNHYNEVKKSFKEKDGKYPDYYYGYMMTVPSYNGRIWGSFAKDGARLYQKAHYLSVKEQLPLIKDCIFGCLDYKDITANNSVIYCDPPYKSSKKDYYNRDFNYDKFYEWCRKMSKNNKIYISECSMPEDFIICWEKEYKRTLANQSKSIKTIEKLYTL